MEEPSVLDYLKSKLRFGRAQKIEIPVEEAELAGIVAPSAEPSPELPGLRPSTPIPWRSLLALVLALVGQSAFEPPRGAALAGLVYYFVAFSTLIWAVYRGEWRLASFPAPEVAARSDPLTVRRFAVIAAAALALVAFLSFGDNLFTAWNVTIWILAILFFFAAFGLGGPRLTAISARLRSFLARPYWQITVTRWGLILLAATALVVFFRFYRLAEVPAEPFSDHAEKILDIYDITQGQTSIFFPRNTGREAFQMYWTLLIARLLGSGLSFFSLKLGSTLLGLLTLLFMYLLGREIGGPRIGLLTFVFAGIAYWPNVISRAGLRFPLYPLFVAPTLLYLVRGLRRRNRNDFLLSGLFLGLGLHGYSPFRIVPLVVLAAIGLYLLHVRSKEARRDALLWLLLLALTALLVFLPLLRYWLDNPEIFSYRAFTRLGSVEQPLPGPWYQVLLANLWNALRMFNWDDGEIWVHSVTHRPALDVVSAALFLIGVVLVLLRYLRQRNWLDLFLLLSIPLLLLPSILSLAFPGENPALNRAAGAMVPVFLLVAMSLDGLISALLGTGLTSPGSGARRGVLAAGLTGFLLLVSALQNYNLVFYEYHNQYVMSAWNSSEMGAVIDEFRDNYGSSDTVWIVPFPHWVDTRLPGVWAGIPNRDFAVWRENLPQTVEAPYPKLFMFWPEDEETRIALQELYPQGVLTRYTSQVQGHDFMRFFVLAP